MTHPAPSLERPIGEIRLEAIPSLRTGTSLEGELLARDLGAIQVRPGGKARIVIKYQGERRYLGKFPVGSDHWVTMTPELADIALKRIRATFAATQDLERSIAPYDERAKEDRGVLTVMNLFLDMEERRLAEGDIRPRTFRELKRKLKRDGGYFSFWRDWSIDAVNYGALEEWSLWLREEFEIGAKTANHALDDLKRCMKWFARRGKIGAVPDFPRLKQEKKPPAIMEPEDVLAVITGMPRTDQGIYLALYHAIRPCEARPLDLVHCKTWEVDGEKRARVRIERSMDGAEAAAGWGPTKNRQTRTVGANVLLADWIHERIAEATPEERLRREGVPLFVNPRGKVGARRWSHWSIIERWQTACTDAEVEYVSPYHLKHSAATELAMLPGVTGAMLRNFLGHASPGTEDVYLNLARERVEDMRR